jgi:hypothetical protein
MSEIRLRETRSILWIALLSMVPGLALLPSACFAQDLQVTVFGPKQYLRTTNSVDVFTDNFLGVQGNGAVIIQNGDGNGKNLVSDLMIVINGVPLADWSALLQPGYRLEAPILMGRNNSILVIILGKPGGYLTFQAQAEITPDATTTQTVGIAGGTVSVENHLGDTFMLQVPPLALDEDTSISVSALPQMLPSPIAQNLSPGVVFGPSGLVFSLPATLTATLHQPLGNSVAVMSWLEDSDYALPTPNQTLQAAQNSMQTEIYHFSPPVFVGIPTFAELQSMAAKITSQPYTTPENLVDSVNGLLTLAKVADILGYPVEEQDFFQDAREVLENGIAKIENSPLPDNPCGQYSLLMKQLLWAIDELDLPPQVDEPLAHRTCTFHLSPGSLDLFLAGTGGISATLRDPRGSVKSCSVINWYSANLDVVDVAGTGNSCAATGAGPGTANVSANCDGLVAGSTVTVCGLIGTYQGTFSGQRISCAKRDKEGCCIEWGGLNEKSKPVTVTFSQNGTSVSAVIFGLDFTGTNINGNVNLQATTTAACGTISVPAGIVGTLSPDCSTLSGSFYVDKLRRITGTFSVERTTAP